MYVQLKLNKLKSLHAVLSAKNNMKQLRQSFRSLNISHVKLPQMLCNVPLKWCKIRIEQSFNDLLTTTGIKKQFPWMTNHHLLKLPLVWILKSFSLWWQLIWSRILHIKDVAPWDTHVCQKWAIKMNTEWTVPRPESN